MNQNITKMHGKYGKVFNQIYSIGETSPNFKNVLDYSKRRLSVRALGSNLWILYLLICLDRINI